MFEGVVCSLRGRQTEKLRARQKIGFLLSGNVETEGDKGCDCGVKKRPTSSILRRMCLKKVLYTLREARGRSVSKIHVLYREEKDGLESITFAIKRSLY